jgi:hypothetical protein
VCAGPHQELLQRAAHGLRIGSSSLRNSAASSDDFSDLADVAPTRVDVSTSSANCTGASSRVSFRRRWA